MPRTMPRGARLDHPGALHHVIARGIERRDIFYADIDRRDFLDRLAQLVPALDIAMYAWCLLTNHLLVRSGGAGLSAFAQHLLGGYASAFNRRHEVWGRGNDCNDPPRIVTIVPMSLVPPCAGGFRVAASVRRGAETPRTLVRPAHRRRPAIVLQLGGLEADRPRPVAPRAAQAQQYLAVGRQLEPLLGDGEAAIGADVVSCVSSGRESDSRK